MHDFAFLRDLLLAFALGGAVVFALRPLRVPPLVGLLVAGALAGPHALNLIRDVHRVEVLAEIGVVLLLFTIGLEFSLAQLVGMWRTILGGGGGQVVLTTLAVAAMTYFRGDAPGGKAVFFGFLVALSSTAIVLRLLGDSGKLGTPSGRIALGVLLFQDLCIVPMMLLAPFCAGVGGGSTAVFMTLGKAVLIVVGVVIAARKLVPPILFQVVRTRSRELFLTLLVVLCLGTAYLTSVAGLSLALGAFLAGLAVSESEYGHQALAEAVPFRDAFGSLFFLSIGMLMDVGFVVSNLMLVSGTVLAIVMVKLLCAALPVLLLGHGLPIVLRSSFALAQVGEFAFVLAHTGKGFDLLSQHEYQVFLAASVVTMIATPLLLKVGEIASGRAPVHSRMVPWGKNADVAAGAEHQVSEHVIIVGYGVNGRNVARALRSTSVPYVILELNPETVRRARDEGEPIDFGDSTRIEILQHAGLKRARAVVVAISDATATRATVSLVRMQNPDVFIVVRTRFVAEVEELKGLGADEVIPEEFETSIEIFSQVLHHFDVPRNVVLDLVEHCREGMYQMLRSPSSPAPVGKLGHGDLARLPVDTLILRPGAPADGKTLRELDLRNQTGASLVAIRRGEELISNPSPDTRLEAGDRVILVGSQEELDGALLVFAGGAEPPRPGRVSDDGLDVAQR